MEAWHRSMREAEECVCKVSALIEFNGPPYGQAPSSVEAYRPILDTLWDQFGADRLMYASNWPVSDKGGSYDVVFKIVSDYFQPKGAEACEKFFWKNSSQPTSGWSGSSSTTSPRSTSSKPRCRHALLGEAEHRGGIHEGAVHFLDGLDAGFRHGLHYAAMHLMIKGSPLERTMPVMTSPSLVFTSLPSNPWEMSPEGLTMALVMTSAGCCLRRW